MNLENPDGPPDAIELGASADKTCFSCKFAGCDPDGTYCGHDQSFAQTGYGLSLRAMRAGPCGADYKLWEVKV